MNPDAPVSRIMTTKIVTVDVKAPLTEIRRIFEDNTFHHLPVMDSGKLAGIISKGDFLQVSHTLSFEWDGRDHIDDRFSIFTAKDIMTEYPMRLEPDDTIGLAADIFLANRFHALPVVDDGELRGMVTSHDLLAYAFGMHIVYDELIEDFEEL